jgi:hypothetical protein
MDSSISTHRGRQAKYGSSTANTVVSATRENASPVQKSRSCQPRMIVAVADMASRPTLSAIARRRNRAARDRQ